MEREIVITKTGQIEVIYPRGKQTTLQDLSNFIYKLLVDKLNRGEIFFNEEVKLQKKEEVINNEKN